MTDKNLEISFSRGSRSDVISVDKSCYWNGLHDKRLEVPTTNQIKCLLVSIPLDEIIKANIHSR